jgi:hypothetical protein
MKQRFVLAVDDFYPHPQNVRARALQMPYRKPPHHAGFRSPPHHQPGIKARIERALGARIARWSVDLEDSAFGNGAFFMGFSAGRFADPGGVHFDTPKSFVTLVVYLTPGAPEGSGTSFWQHRETGLIAGPTPSDAKRLGATTEELSALLNGDGLRPRKWIEIERAGNRYNRAVFFRSGMLHSATRHFGSTLANGRIYQTFRFDL